MVKSSFTGRVRLQVRNVLTQQLVYEYEDDNKIVGLDLYRTSPSALDSVRLGKGFIEPDNVPKNPDGSIQTGWYKADGIFYFKKETAGNGKSDYATQNVGATSYKLVHVPQRNWEITTRGYRFQTGAFAGKDIDCVFVGNDWSVIHIPQFTPTQYDEITVWYTLCFYPDISSGSYELDLGSEVHTVTYKPALWNEPPISTNIATSFDLALAEPRVTYYTNVTSLGSESGTLNGEAFFSVNHYLKGYIAGTHRCAAEKIYDINDLNNASNGISGLLIVSGSPFQRTQLKIDPPIMKNTNMKLTLWWVHEWGVVNEEKV